MTLFQTTNGNGKPKSTWLDRAIAWASPERGQRRLASRLALDVVNSYKGGVPTRLSEYWPREQGFRFGQSGDRANLASARDRAYQAYRNNPIARTLVQTETDNVIGDGLNYQPASDSPEWNREAEDRYYEWLENCSVRGRDIHSGCELQRELWSRSRVAGDIGWILVARGTESLVQVVPSENIVTPDGRHGEQNIYDGIRWDGFGRPEAYFVFSTDERGKRDFAEIGWRDFVFLPHIPDGDSGGSRGQTCYLTVFDYLAHLDRYVDGVSLAAWMATVFGILFKNTSGGSAVGTLGDLTTDSQGVERRAVTLENGMVKYIGTDEDVAQVQAHQPMQQTPEFIRTMMRLIGQPFDMPLAIILKDTSQENFASARIGLLPFYRSCRIKAARFASRWSRTIQWWLSREAQRAPGDPKRWKTAFPENYWKHELLPNAWSYTDPVSEAQGDHLQLDMKITSPQMVIAERGRDARKILDDWKAWQEQTKDLPQLHSTLTRDPAPDPAEAPPPAIPDEEEEQSDEQQ